MKFIIASIFLITFSFDTSNQTNHSNTLNIEQFLQQPFHLFTFKKIKKQSNSGGAGETKYFYRPKEKGFYMRFLLFPPMRGYIGKDSTHLLFMENGIEIITYKPYGKHQSKYLDPKETLIQITTRYNDKDLPELRYIGYDSSSIIKQFGKPNLRKADTHFYYIDNKVLLFCYRGNKAKTIRYTRLNHNFNPANIPVKLIPEE